MSYRPRRPYGNSNEMLFMQSVWDELWGKGSGLNQTPGTLVCRTTKGDYVIVRRDTTPQASPKGGPTQVVPCSLIAVWGDYLLVTNLLTGLPIRVAKEPLLRNSIQREVYFGNAFTYTYPRNPAAGAAPTDPQAYQRRLVAPAQEFQDVTQPWCVSTGATPATVLFVEEVSYTTGVVTDPADTGAPGGTPVTYQDTNRGGRAWMRSPNQTAP